MAFAHLSLQGAIWRGLGLRSLLMPSDIATNLSRTPAEQGAGQILFQATGQSAQRPPAQAARQRQGRHSSPRAAAPGTGRTSQADRADSPNTATAPQALRQAVWQPHPPQSWPPAWQARLQATRPGLIVWTYWQLGADICGTDADEQGMAQRQARRTLLQRMLADLGHPGGTHTFWPVCLPASAPAGKQPDSEYQPLADIFWSGVGELGARGVVVMGSQAAQAVDLPADLSPPHQIRFRGHLVWILPDAEILLQEPQRYNPMLAFLQQALRQLVRR